MARFREAQTRVARNSTNDKHEHRQMRRRALAAKMAAIHTLPGLGVRIRDEQVFKGFWKEGQRLGDLAGAHAEVTTETRHHRAGAAAAASVVLGPVGLLAGLSKKSQASAFIVFADGSIFEHKLEGASAIRKRAPRCSQI